MPQSDLYLIRRIREWVTKKEIGSIPDGLRGVYVLYKENVPKGTRDVVYIGLARNGFKGRLWAHQRNEKKAKQWDCCSLYEVWDNIRDEQIQELEGLFRHIYRKDLQANRLNVQGSFGKLKRLKKIELDK